MPVQTVSQSHHLPRYFTRLALGLGVPVITYGGTIEGAITCLTRRKRKAVHKTNAKCSACVLK